MVIDAALSLRATYCIAGFAFALEAKSAAGLEPLLADWAPFAHPGPPATTLALKLGPAGPAAAQTALPLAEPRADGGLSLRGEGFEAQLAADRATGELTQSGDRGPTEAVVRMLLAEWLARRGGVLVHGVAVASNGKAAVFTGPSGAGKSTLGACAAAGALTVLADELVALVPFGEGFAAHGTPWNVGAPGSAALARLGLLAHAPAPALAPVAPTEVLRVLLSNVLEPSDSPAARAHSFRCAQRLLASAPASTLSFAPDASVAAVLTEALR